MTKKYIALLIILSFLCFNLVGCYDARGLETLSFAIAIGLDEGDNNILKLTIQFAKPTALESGSSSSSSQSSTSTLSTIECSSFESGINIINSYISKQVNLSHCKIIVISESLANKGISKYLYSFVNNVEVRPDCNIIISRCDAKDYLSNSKPTMETLSARFYEVVLNSSHYTGYTENITLYDFYSAYQDSISQPIAILGRYKY